MARRRTNNPKKNIEKGAKGLSGAGLAYFFAKLFSGLIVANNPDNADVVAMEPALTGAFTAIIGGVMGWLFNRIMPHYEDE